MRRLGYAILAMVMATGFVGTALAAQGGSPLAWQDAFSPTDPRLYAMYTAVDLGNYNSPPYEPSDPNPPDGAPGISLTPTLSWTGGDPDPGDYATYTVGFGTTSGMLDVVATGLVDPMWSPPDPLEYETTYYWQITAEDTFGATTEGPEWRFSTLKMGDPTATMTVTALPTLTPTMTGGPMTPTPTVAEITISLEMPGMIFSGGDTCYLKLHTMNPGAEQNVDLYILLNVFGEYWSYPSWSHLSMGLDFDNRIVPAGADTTEDIIPEFTMPPVSTAGPLYFYGAMFEAGFLDLDHLVSTGAVAEFWFEGN